MTNNWTVTDIAERFEEAAATLRRLPNVKVRGYFNAWPQIIRTVREKLDEDKEAYRHSPPQPDAISRMEETIQWVFFQMAGVGPMFGISFTSVYLISDRFPTQVNLVTFLNMHLKRSPTQLKDIPRK